jgi:hypothetical protein
MEDDLMAVGQGIAMVHPEFKQERMTMDVETDDGNHHDVPYILITMPDVDDNRYDLLKESVKALYETCKAQMEAACVLSQARIGALTSDMSPEEADNVKKAVDERREMWTQHRDKQYNDKLQEIEDGHQRWQQQQAAREQQQGDNGSSVATSMRLTN